MLSLLSCAGDTDGTPEITLQTPPSPLCAFIRHVANQVDSSFMLMRYVQKNGNRK